MDKTVETVAEYGTHWLERARLRVAPHTATAYETMLRRWIVPTLGALPIATVTRSQLRIAVTKWHRAGLAPGTIRRALVPLQGLLQDAVEEEVLPANPAHLLARTIFGRAKGWAPRPERAMRDAELARFYEAAPHVCRTLWDYWLVLHRAGLRPGEGLALRWDDVDTDRRKVLVARTYSRGDLGPRKTGRAYWADLSQDVLVALARRRAEMPGFRYLFPSPVAPHRPWDSSSVVQVFHRICRRAGISERFTPHCLRHTWATWLIEAEVPVRYVQQGLDHASVQTTEGYFRGARIENPGYVDLIDARMRRPPQRALGPLVHVRRSA